MKEIADFARLLDCPVVALHLGFITHDRESKDYTDIVAVTRDLCDHCRNNEQDLHLETGRKRPRACSSSSRTSNATTCSSTSIRPT